MGNTTTITIELCAEDRARLDRIFEALERKCNTAVIEPTIEPTVEEEPPTKPAEEVTPPPVAEPVRQIDRAELRAKVIELSSKGFKEQTREIVQAYAPTVASVPEDKIAECFDRLNELNT